MDNNKKNENENENKSINLENLDFDDFKNNVKKYLNIDDDIKKLEKHIRELKQGKQKISGLILTFMNNHNIEDLNTETGTLKKNVKYLKKPLSKKNLKNKLLEYYKNNEDQSELVFKFIDNRAKEEKIELKRIFKKE